jgi:replication factor C large subunit
MTWIEIYRPKSFSEIKGQDLAVGKAKFFVKNFGRGKRAMILHGPPGTGKTTLAHAIAKELNAEIFELNASDLRNKQNIKEILKPAIEQRSLMKKGKIILIDEVDGISAVDRGGLTELLALIKTTPYPLIITANDIWDRKLNDLRRNAELVQLKEVEYKIVREILSDILKKENLIMNPNIVASVAMRAKGDIRAAINDLQTASRLIDPSEIIFYERDKESDIFNTLKKIFQQKPDKENLVLFDSLNMTLDDIMLWIEENIPAEYKGEELAKAFDSLSRADVFKGRIYKQQYWRFLVYESILLSYGIAAAKKNTKTGFTSYKRPSRILKIWMNNQRTIKKKSIAQKYAKHVHVGEKRAMNEFPIIKQIIVSNPEIAKELRLDEEEIEYLKS